MAKLSVELVPKTAWYSNVRSNVSKSEWDKIRKKVYAEAGHVCEICGGVGKRHPVECHEVWEYDDKKHIQKLASMIALCPACHSAKHLGRAKAVGIYHLALQQLMKVNGWTHKEATDYAKKAFEEWRERSNHPWKLDLRGLNRYTMKKTGDKDGS